MQNRYDQMVSVSDVLCARLARALGSGRYPRFAQLEIAVDAKSWGGELYSVWYSSEIAGNAQKQEVIEKWRRAFGAVEKIPGVVLHVRLASY